jgi:TPR repeat protein
MSSACKQREEAAQKARDGCDGSVTRTCVERGKLAERGIGSAPSVSDAAMFYRKACEARVYVGCVQIGRLTDEGAGVPQDHARAVALYEQACAHDVGAGCNVLGYFQDMGVGLRKRNPTRARELFHKGCEKGSARACENEKIVKDRGPNGTPGRGARWETFPW